MLISDARAKGTAGNRSTVAQAAKKMTSIAQAMSEIAARTKPRHKINLETGHIGDVVPTASMIAGNDAHVGVDFRRLQSNSGKAA